MFLVGNKFFFREKQRFWFWRKNMITRLWWKMRSGILVRKAWFCNFDRKGILRFLWKKKICVLAGTLDFVFFWRKHDFFLFLAGKQDFASLPRKYYFSVLRKNGILYFGRKIMIFRFWRKRDFVFLVGKIEICVLAKNEIILFLAEDLILCVLVRKNNFGFWWKNKILRF